MIPIFLAIDMPDLSDAMDIVVKLDGLVHIKLGLEFFISQGPANCSCLKNISPNGFGNSTRQMILDLKLHDIPNTVKCAVRAAMKISPNFLTLHTEGGMEMMRAAVAAVRTERDRTEGLTPIPKLLGVTVLTSMPKDRGTKGLVMERASQAKKAGLDGVVCSANEVESLREMWPEGFLLVPGIRPVGADVQDQKRIATPRSAMKSGASALVIGRPITQAPDPRQAAVDIIQSMQ